jgi:hypothetical protein
MSAIHIDGTLEIATGVPATRDKAGYEALVWAAIGGLIEAPAFATTHADVQVPSLSGRTRIMKGAETGVASSVSWEDVANDPGQAALIAAAVGRGEYSLRWTPPGSPTADYSSGIVKDYSPNKPTNGSFAGGTCQFVPNYQTVTETVPA